MAEEQWLAALRAGFAESFFEGNRKAFLIGREGQKPKEAKKSRIVKELSN